MRDPDAPEKILIRWPSPPSNLSLGHDEIHVWAWDYEYSSDDLRRYISLLSPDEHLRMMKFYFEKARARYAVSHGILRSLLGRYLDLPPSSIRFEKNEFGKPHLAADFRTLELEFNLSHTDRLGLLAIANGSAVGVDIEEIRPVEPRTVEHYFSAREQASLTHLKGSDWLEGFYSCWTSKEAILKAEGIGLNVKLDAFDVSLSPNVKATVLGVRPDAGLTSNWRLTDLRPAPGVVGALATNTSAPAKIRLAKFV